MFLYKYNIFQKDECKKYIEKVNSLSSNFIYEIDGYFSTLGVAAYQHAENFELYCNRVNDINFLLWNSFESIYIKLKDFFEDFFKCKVLYPALKLSLPGFHIFEIGRRQCFYGGSPHYDLSYKTLPYINWNENELYPDHYSFTISFQLPYYGSGLNIWEFQLTSETQSLTDLQIRQICTAENKTFVNYNVGEMVLFNGYNYHQISEIKKTKESDRRITMQGHLIKNNNKLLIYW